MRYQKILRAVLLAAFAAGLLVAGGCGGEAVGVVPNNPRGDGQVVAALMTVDTGEVQQGQLALARAQDPTVRDFARQMVTEHLAALGRLQTMEREQGISPIADATSQELDAEAAKALATLQARTGYSFDISYIDIQVTMHQRVLDVIDRELMPIARSQIVQNELRGARADVSTHLGQARQIQRLLGVVR